MLKIRLRRMGSRHRPFYRVVISDGRSVPGATAIEEIGYYDPRKHPAVLSLDVERVEHWLARGAQPSDTVKRLIERARKGQNPLPLPPRPARTGPETSGVADAAGRGETATAAVPTGQAVVSGAAAGEAQAGEAAASEAQESP